MQVSPLFIFVIAVVVAAPCPAQDPGPIWSSFLGGTGFEAIEGAAQTSTGDWVVTGSTSSTGLGTVGAYQDSIAGGTDGFVAKFSADGSTLLWFTYLGGTASDEAYGVVVDSQDRPILLGNTESTPFASTSLPGYEQALPGGEGGFLCRLSFDGSTLDWWTYIGGSNFDEAYDLAIGTNDEPYACGMTDSWDFPIVGSAATPHSTGEENAFLMRFSADGTTLLLSTCLGGQVGGVEARRMTLGPGQTWAMLIGNTDDPSLATPGAYQTAFAGGAGDAFLARVDLTTGGFTHVSYLGGGAEESLEDVKVRANGEVVAVGSTASPDFPTLPGAYQATHAGLLDVVVVRFDDTLANLVASTFVGTGGNELCIALASETSGITLAMGASEPGFPMTPGPWDAYFNDSPGKGDVVMVRLDESLQSLEYASHLGGNGLEAALDVHVDQGDQVLVVGITGSSTFPMRGGGHDDTYSGQFDGFLTAFHLQGGPTLQAGNLQRGQSTLLQVDGVALGETVYFALSAVGPGFGPAPSGFGDARLDLSAPILLGVVPASGSGTADLSIQVPSGAPLITVHLQALIRRGPLGATSLTADLVEKTIIP
jgi:hypothetical protein